MTEFTFFNAERRLPWLMRFVALLVGFLIFPYFSAFSAASDPYFEKPLVIQIDSQRGIGYVLDGNMSGRLTAFSLNDPSKWVAFNVGYTFSDQYFDQASGRLYITSSHPQDVRIFRSEDIAPYLGRGLIDDYAVLPFKAIPLDSYPVLIEGMAFDSEHTRAFIALYGSEGKIAVINSDYSIEYINTGASVYRPVYDQKTGLLSVIHLGSPFVSFVNPTTKIVTRLELKAPAIYAGIDDSRGRLYVLHATEPAISIIDLNSKKKIAEVALPAVMPTWIGINAANGDVYVSDEKGETVIVLAGNPLRVLKRIALPGLPGFGVIDSELNIVALAGYKEIFIIDGNTKTLKKVIPTDNLPQTLALDKPTHRIVTGGFYGDSVTIISLRDLTYRKLGKFSQLQTPSFSTRGKYFAYAESLLDVDGEIWVGNRGGFFTFIKGGEVAGRLNVSKEFSIWPIMPEFSGSTVAPFFYNGKVYAPTENGIAVIDAAKKSIVSTIELSENFMPVWWIHEENMLYALDEDARALAVDIKTGKVASEAAWGGVPSVFAKQGNRLFLASMRSNLLRIFDDNLKPVGEITLPDLSSMALPKGISVNNSRGEVYILFFDMNGLRLFAVSAEKQEVLWKKEIPILHSYGFASVWNLISDDMSRRLAIISFAGGVQIIDERDGRVVAERAYSSNPILPEAFDKDSGTLYLYDIDGILVFNVRDGVERPTIPFSYNTSFFRETLFSRGKLYASFASDVVAEIDVKTNHSRIFFNPDGVGLSLAIKKGFTNLEIGKGVYEHTPRQSSFIPKTSQYLIGAGVFLIAIGILVFVLRKRRQDQAV